LIGPDLLRKTRREEERLATGWTYEPPTFYETNNFVDLPIARDAPHVQRCCYVTPHITPERRVTSQVSSTVVLASSAAAGN
jgi:hypothetical protein